MHHVTKKYQLIEGGPRPEEAAPMEVTNGVL